jgi:hypothetical protein
MEFLYVDHYKIFKSARSVVLTGRSTDNDRSKHHFLINNFYPYFGVPWDERDTHKTNTAVVSITPSYDIHQNKIAIIKVKRADHVSILRDDYIQVLEAKILFHDRLRIDLGIKSKFTVPDKYFSDTKCFSCGGAKYHRIPYEEIKGW